MSSDEFQILRINQRTREINPRQNTSRILQNKTSYQKVSSSKISQPVSTFVSRRELNQSSPVYTGGKIQLPVRTNVATNTRSTQIKYKYEPNKTATRQISSVNKVPNQTQTQRYKSSETQYVSKKYETSGSPINRRRNIPMTFNRSNRSGNFNMKNWSYVSKQVINQIIVIQRWWRYLLQNIIYRKGRFSRNYNKASEIRSKSTSNPTCEFLKDFIKQGENITEKRYTGKNNKIVVETRKVEGFKNLKPKSKNQLKVKKTGENITERIYQTRNNKLINEKRTVEVFQVNKPQVPKDIKLINTQSGQYALRIQKTTKYIDKEKEKQTIINERRKGEPIKIREPKRINDLQISNKETRRIRGHINQNKKFEEENGITKSYIKEKMIEIWLDECSKTKENSFKLIPEQIQSNRFSTINSKNTISSNRNISSDNKDEINNLYRIIKEKNNELNKIVNQLKVEMNKNKSGVNTQRTQINVNKYNYTFESQLNQLLNKIKEKDEQINKLMNKGNTQRTTSRSSENRRDKSPDNYTKINKTYIKNVYDSINRTSNTEEYDTLNTQNTINNEIYENKIAQLETLINEKDTELETITKELNNLKENPAKPEFNDLIFEQNYGLGIYSDNQPWINTVQFCPINNLYICDKKDWNEVNEISQLDLSILNISKNWEDEIIEEGNNALCIEAAEKDSLLQQKINLLQINGTPIFEKWLDEIKPDNDLEKFLIESEPKEENIIQENNALNIASLEKEENKIQNINCLYIQGVKMPWENLSKENKEIFIQKKEKEENIIESRDSIQVISLEKDPLQKQLINALIVEGFEKAENEIQRAEEVSIDKEEKEENLIEQRDSITIIGYEKDELFKQNINQLNIEGIHKEENICQKTMELVIEKTSKPDLNINSRDSIQILGAEKEKLIVQSINELFIEEIIRDVNEIKKIEQFIIEAETKPENILESRDSLEIIGYEKDPLVKQAINQLIILAIPKPENIYQHVTHVEITQIQRPENFI